MSETIQKTPKQRNTQRKCRRKISEMKQPSTCCCAKSSKTSAMVASSFMRYKHAGPPRGGGGNRGYFPGGSQTFFLEKGTHGAFKLLPFWDASSRCFLFPLHCLDSMSERLGRIISNTFMANTLTRINTSVEPTPLIN